MFIKILKLIFMTIMYTMIFHVCNLSSRRVFYPIIVALQVICIILDGLANY